MFVVLRMVVPSPILKATKLHSWKLVHAVGVAVIGAIGALEQAPLVMASIVKVWLLVIPLTVITVFVLLTVTGLAGKAPVNPE